MFRIEMLPAAHGDCLFIECGTKEQFQRVLIDGGPAHTYPALRQRILHLPPGERHFDLLIITHIDADHIEGIVRLFQDAAALGVSFERVWFNGRDQLNKVPDPAGEPLGALQGEMLGMLIADYEKRVGRDVLNLGFPDRLVAIDRAAGQLPEFDVGECRLTLLSPDHTRLLELKDHWAAELKKARVESGDEHALRRKLEESRALRPLGDVLGDSDAEGEEAFEFPAVGDVDLAEATDDVLGGSAGEPGADARFGEDDSLANGSSIAIVLQYPKDDPQVRILLAGDAWPSVLETSIDVIRGDNEKKLKLTGFKLPHHGSVANVTEALLGKIQCKHFLVSTSGAVFRHPHARAIELLLHERSGQGKPRLHFNYHTKTTSKWSDPEDQKARRYEATHPKGMSLEL